MQYSVDVSQEYQQAKNRMLKYSLCFALVLTLVIVGDGLLVILAPNENYLLNLIIAIILTVLFSWGAIFFFTSIYGDINSRYKYFRGYESGLKPTEEVEFFKKSEEMCYVNGLYVYPVYVRYKAGLMTQDKVIFSLDNNFDYEMGDLLTITTYQRILVKAEKHS